MLGKRNRETQQDVALEKIDLSKDDVFKQLVEEYASSRMDLIIRLRQKRITDEEFMTCVDDSLKKIDAETEVKDQARLMFYQYVFCYFRLHSLSADTAAEKIVDYALQASQNMYTPAELLKMIASCYHTIINVKDYKVYEVLAIDGWEKGEKKDELTIKYKTLYHL